MVAIAFVGASPKGKGVTMNILLFIMAFLLGFVAGVDLNLTNRIESTDITEIDWDEKNPPLWSLRPEEHFSLFSSNKAGIGPLGDDKEDPKYNPCEDRTRAPRLYKSFYGADCPPKFHYMSMSGRAAFTCEKWDVVNKELECATFCQTRTQFEWAEERPFPHSDCHYPVKCSISEHDSTAVGWGVSMGAKIGKALKAGVSGSYSQKQSHSYGRSYSVELNETLACGYFTFVAVKKMVCGILSEAVPGLRSYPSDDEGGVTQYCNVWGGPIVDGGHWALNHHSYCTNELWEIDNKQGKRVPDGVFIFVYTDCKTRTPMPMEYQSDIYKKKGVALDHLTVRSLHDSWIWNDCYFYDLGKENGKYKTLFMHGSGFSDDQIGGHNGEGLMKKIADCAGGDIKNAKFSWYDSGYPGDDAKLRGAVWLIRAEMPKGMNGGCVGQAIMDAGGKTVDQCRDGS
ncbi:uncharacterized protein CTRU02_214637 [Colletotrichum truncatum]|uniref:Uncharacterized protein n=1 Tax=Colletotrichum truncatum TaxID=5467 RepID=A0ACC3YFC3_COLTU|nr:uncharacterized protein CTRU02_09586 [Colletotrichum truncatum]KAF6788268.1 hypothetical protein CTRU02_09586 [Colletotrichum truncatum]